MLEDEPDICVVGEASNGADAVVLAQQLAPRVVVMDLSMPVMDGVEATREILRQAPATAVLMISVDSEAHCVRSALAAGARGYLLKNVDLDLGSAVRDVACGKAVQNNTVE